MKVNYTHSCFENFPEDMLYNNRSQINCFENEMQFMYVYKS